LSGAYGDQGLWKLAELRIDYEQSKHSLIDIPSDLTDFSTFSTNGKTVALLTGGPAQFNAVALYDPARKQLQTVKSASDITISPDRISKAEAISFDTENGGIAYAFYYPPVNPDFEAPEAELPPLLVESHGGPTAAASGRLSLSINIGRAEVMQSWM